MCELFGDDQSIVSHQGLTRGPDPLLAVRGQRDVGGAGVLAGEGPFGLAVSDDEAAGGRHRNV
jgi:hypothetical protein